MKTKARLAAMGKPTRSPDGKRSTGTRDRVRKFQLAADAIPGTEFDGMINSLLDALQMCGDSPTCSPPPSVDGVTERRAMGEHTLMQWGYVFAKEVERAIRPLGKHQIPTDYFYNLAKALEAWRKHRPEPGSADRLRQGLIQLCAGDGPFEVRDLMRGLEAMGFSADEDTRRLVYRQCRVLGFPIRGKPGHYRANPDKRPG